MQYSHKSIKYVPTKFTYSLFRKRNVLSNFCLFENKLNTTLVHPCFASTLKILNSKQFDWKFWQTVPEKTCFFGGNFFIIFVGSMKLAIFKKIFCLHFEFKNLLCTEKHHKYGLYKEATFHYNFSCHSHWLTLFHPSSFSISEKRRLRRPLCKIKNYY